MCRLLILTEGTTLRTLLSKVLNCDPMRITKKYTGNSSIGKRTFVPLVRSAENAIFMDMSQQDLRELRAVWVNKLILMEQWNNRKMNLMKGSISYHASHFLLNFIHNVVLPFHIYQSLQRTWVWAGRMIPTARTRTAVMILPRHRPH